MPSSSSLNRVRKTRSVVNLAIGVLVLIVGSWWVVATYVNAQKSLKASSEEWTRLRRCIDQRWSKLSDLSAIYFEEHNSKNPYDFDPYPKPVWPGSPEYTFQEYAEWKKTREIKARLETVRVLEGSMSEFLQRLEQSERISNGTALSAFHRDLALSQNELEQRIASYNQTALDYNRKIEQFPASILLIGFELRPLPLF